MRRPSPCQLPLPGFEVPAEPVTDPPIRLVDPPPELVIPSELRMTVAGWSLPQGWVLQRGESAESAIAAFLAMEARRSKGK
jgi:hypothetical protein